MVTAKDFSDNLSGFPLTTAYQTSAKFWARSDKVDRMLELLRHALDAALCPTSLANQLRRFAVWCARSTCHLNTADPCKVALETAERFLAGGNPGATRPMLERESQCHSSSRIGRIGTPMSERRSRDRVRPLGEPKPSCSCPMGSLLRHDGASLGSREGAGGIPLSVGGV